MGYQMKYFSIRLTQLHSVKLRVELIVLIYPDPPVIQRLSFTSSRNLFSGQHKLPTRHVYTSEIKFIALKMRSLLKKMLEMIIVLSQKTYDLINQKKIVVF